MTVSRRRDRRNDIIFVRFWALSFLSIFQALSGFWIRFQIIPPHGCFSFQLVHCNSSFCMGRIILQLEVFLHAKQPCLGIFLLLMFSIECWRLNLVHLSFQFLPSRFPMFSGRGWAWTIVCLLARMIRGERIMSVTTPWSPSPLRGFDTSWSSCVTPLFQFLFYYFQALHYF